MTPSGTLKRSTTLDERSWALLLQKIQNQRCTPFLGSEASFGAVPAGSELAREWAREYGYPLQDSGNLARVSQFVATDYDLSYPKLELRSRLLKVPAPDFTDPQEPHAALADLPLPVYITTDYHDFMTQALRSRNKDPRQEICPWHRPPAEECSVFSTGYVPTPANPIVYHLQGHISDPDSVVLTEDDYLDFLVNTARNANDQIPVIPARIQEAFTNATLLFLGYRLSDLEFRVLLRSLVNFMRINSNRGHISVQLVAVGESLSEAQVQGAQEYLRKYCELLNMGVYWGTSREFVTELRQRWEHFHAGH